MMTTQPGKPMPERVNVSVIIPCLNEERAIGECLDSLVRQEIARGAFEVIVVDNGSTDRTLEIVRSYSSALKLTVLSRPGAKISALRNAGVAASQGQWLAFLDADCVVSPDWLSRAAALLAEKDCGVIGGYYCIPANSSWVARAWWDDRASKTKTGKVSYIPSSDLLISRENFEKVGGFDETLVTNEDCEFSQRASKAGLSIIAYPELGVTHLGSPQTIRAFYRRERWHGASVFRVFLRNIRAFPNAKAVMFAFYILLCMIGLALGMIRAAASGKIDVLLASAAALLLAPASIGTWKACHFDKWSDLLPMTFLYLVYGVARARCLLDFGGARVRRRISDG